MKSKGKGKGAHTSTEKKNNGRIHGATERFHLKLKHLLAGVSFLSLFAAFEVFSIPATNGIVLLFNMSRAIAGETWIGVALVSGGIAVFLHREEKSK